MALIHEMLSEALQHHQAGRLTEAEALYLQVLQAHPEHHEALYRLGLIAHQTGRHEDAVEYIGQALRLNPGAAEYHNNIGTVYRALGKLEEAAVHYRQALALRPAYAMAHNNLGLTLGEQGKLEEAVVHYRQVLALQPDYAEAYNNLGNALKAQGKLEEAVTQYRQALALRPVYAMAHNNLGAALSEQGTLEEAVVHYRQALTLQPAFAEAYNNLGNALKEQGKLEEAVAQYRQAVVLKPAFVDAYNNLGNALKEQGKLEEAIMQYRQALGLKPDYAEAMNNMGSALQGQGKLEEGVAQYRQALALKPDYADAHSNLLFGLHYLPTYDSALLGALYGEWHEKYARHLAPRNVRRENRRESERPLRVGYVSADFKRHPVGYFIEPVLEAHDKSRIKVYCYSMVCKADDVTVRLQALADVWRSIVGMSDEAVAGLIREDGIDILVDLSGHTAGNRLLVFARKPAPVQVTWIGFCAPTGLETMDYLLTDGFYAPPAGVPVFAEQLFHMPANHLCFRPPAFAPPVSPCPAVLRGYPTFGCFNNLSKVNAVVVATWAKILHGVPGARLVLKTYALNDHATRERYRALCQGHGIPLERVDLLGSSPHAELLAQYGQIDIALDPFPYCGGWSTCEALWMGVPVVTLTGPSFSSCVGAGLLSSVGLPQMIARSAEQYVERAVQLGRDVEGLARLRDGLRARMAASPLCDAPIFTHHLEQAYRIMWRKWCSGDSESVKG